MRPITRTAAALIALALIALAITTGVAAQAGNAAKSGNTYGEVENIAGVRYHSVGFDKAFNRDVARLAAWDKAIAACNTRGGYMTEFQAGSTRPIITIHTGVAASAYATCRTDLATSTPDEPFLGDILPTAEVSHATHPVISARGSVRNAYIAVRDRAANVCHERGEFVEHLSIGFFAQGYENTATGNLTCAP